MTSVCSGGFNAVPNKHGDNVVEIASANVLDDDAVCCGVRRCLQVGVEEQMTNMMKLIRFPRGTAHTDGSAVSRLIRFLSMCTLRVSPVC